MTLFFSHSFWKGWGMEGFIYWSQMYGGQVHSSRRVSYFKIENQGLADLQKHSPTFSGVCILKVGNNHFFFLIIDYLRKQVIRII